LHGDEDYKQCNILKMRFYSPLKDGTFLSSERTFTYNKWGNPIKVDVTNVGTGNPIYEFKYDGQQRLIQTIAFYSNGAIDFLQKYKYDNNNLISSDSTYYNGTYGVSGPENFFGKGIDIYGYDANRRLILVTSHITAFGFTNTLIKNFLYDADGNLSGFNHDLKMNINRTNKVWMFLNRNYSVNNTFVADSYNNSGLPTKIPFAQTNSSDIFLGLNLGAYNSSEVDYQCK